MLKFLKLFSTGERILKNVTNNPGLIEQLICSNQDSEEEHDQCEDDLPHSNKYYSKGNIIKHQLYQC